MASKGFWAGWVVFAGVVMLVVGSLNIIQGLAALLNDEYFLVTKSGLLVFDFTTWGVIMLVVGGLLVLTAFGLMAVKGWARWLAIIICSLNMIAQITFLSAYPVWALIMIGLNVMILFAATVHWSDVRSA